MKHPAVPISPVHHRRNGQSMWLIFCHFFSSLKLLLRSLVCRSCPRFRPFSPRYDGELHTDCTRNADHRKASFRFMARAGPPQGSAHMSETFLRRDDALRWSRLAELSVDRNETPISSRIGRITKFGELIKLHIEDMTAVGNPVLADRNRQAQRCRTLRISPRCPQPYGRRPSDQPTRRFAAMGVESRKSRQHMTSRAKPGRLRSCMQRSVRPTQGNDRVRSTAMSGTDRLGCGATI
jgi:hypothetical protein